MMRWLGILAGLAAAVFGVLSAVYWFRSARVSRQSAFLPPHQERFVGDVNEQKLTRLLGEQNRVTREIARLNAWAATFAGLAAICAVVASIVQDFGG
jgi:hypothetical protein